MDVLIFQITLMLLGIQNPLLILIVGSVGLGLNVLVMSFLHGKRKSTTAWTSGLIH
jgi:hypothetical protein